jgi:hypothetical protein
LLDNGVVKYEKSFVYFCFFNPYFLNWLHANWL